MSWQWYPVPRYRFGDFVLSPRRRMLVLGGDEQPLIPRYFDLLVFLVEHRHEAVHRRDIFDRVWNDVVVSDSALSQAIRTIRRTLRDDPREPRFIRTVSRHGYRFICPDVLEEDDDDWPYGERAPVADVAVLDQPVPTTAAADLALPRSRRAALASARCAEASIGGGLAGVVAGATGGLILAAAPSSAAPIVVAPVLAVIGGFCGALGGAGVGAGLAVADAIAGSQRTLALVCGAAAGGGLIGSAVQWLGRWSLATLVGVHVDVGGSLEGLAIGAAAGLGHVVASGAGRGSAGRLRAAVFVAAACGLAALGVTLAGRPLVGGTIHAIAQASRGSQVTMTPLGALIGEPDFGPVTRAVIGTGEGALFGLGLALGLTRRP